MLELRDRLQRRQQDNMQLPGRCMMAHSSKQLGKVGVLSGHRSIWRVKAQSRSLLKSLCACFSMLTSRSEGGVAYTSNTVSAQLSGLFAV